MTWILSRYSLSHIWCKVCVQAVLCGVQRMAIDDKSPRYVSVSKWYQIGISRPLALRWPFITLSTRETLGNQSQSTVSGRQSHIDVCEWADRLVLSVSRPVASDTVPSAAGASTARVRSSSPAGRCHGQPQVAHTTVRVQRPGRRRDTWRKCPASTSSCSILGQACPSGVFLPSQSGAAHEPRAAHGTNALFT